jgi:transposase, IS5 family
VPIDTLLRLLYLKHRYGLGYERLRREVADSISWRRFCRIPLDRPVPHTTTLVKLVRRAGPAVIAQLNAGLVGKLGRRQAAAAGPQAPSGHHRGGGQHRLPTDADLLEHAVRKLGGRVRRIKARGRGQQDPVPRSWPCGRALLQCAVRCGAVR